MTNITHKRTKKGNKSPVTPQPIKMHSAGVAGRIKISLHFTFFLAEKEMLESSSNLSKKLNQILLILTFYTGLHDQHTQH